MHGSGLGAGEQMSVDWQLHPSERDHHSRIPREQLAEAAKVKCGARRYRQELEQENADGKPVHQQDKVSLSTEMRPT